MIVREAREVDIRDGHITTETLRTHYCPCRASFLDSASGNLMCSDCDKYRDFAGRYPRDGDLHACEYDSTAHWSKATSNK